MSMNSTLYPSLGRFFENQTQLAHAGCMSRTRLWECLNGRKDFTRAEKKAISANIALRLMNEKSINYQDLENATEAWKGKFDEIYKKKEEKI